VALVNRLQVRPALGRLIAQARRIGAGEADQAAGPASEDEIALLGDEMNRMEKRITEARAALGKEAAARVAMASQLRHVDRLATVGRLSAGVAHEFGTPLAVVRGRARLITDSAEAPEGDREHARVVVEQVDRMSRIIRQLLDLARRRGLPQGPCSLGDLLDRVAHLLEHEAHRTGVALSIEGPPAPIHALGDPQQLEQVALNLVLNAIQALGPGGGLVVLRCGVDPQATPPGDEGRPEPRAWFEVEDDGPGVPEEILPVVFEPFVTTKEPGQGTGLGLPLSVGIIQDHGGWIAVHSPPGSGARFRVYLKPYDVHNPDEGP